MRKLYASIPPAVGACIWSLIFQSRVGLERMDDKHNIFCYHSVVKFLQLHTLSTNDELPGLPCPLL